MFELLRLLWLCKSYLSDGWPVLSSFIIRAIFWSLMHKHEHLRSYSDGLCLIRLDLLYMLVCECLRQNFTREADDLPLLPSDLGMLYFWWMAKESSFLFPKFTCIEFPIPQLDLLVIELDWNVRLEIVQYYVIQYSYLKNWISNSLVLFIFSCLFLFLIFSVFV